MPAHHSITDRLTDEGLELIVAAAEALGVRISPKTALRWSLAGIGGTRLESVKIAGQRMTSRAALRRIFDAQQRDDDALLMVEEGGGVQIACQRPTPSATTPARLTRQERRRAARPAIRRIRR